MFDQRIHENEVMKNIFIDSAMSSFGRNLTGTRPRTKAKSNRPLSENYRPFYVIALNFIHNYLKYPTK